MIGIEGLNDTDRLLTTSSYRYLHDSGSTTLWVRRLDGSSILIKSFTTTEGVQTIKMYEGNEIQVAESDIKPAVNAARDRILTEVNGVNEFAFNNPNTGGIILGYPSGG